MRLIGNVSADPQTGQLTTTIADSAAGPVHLLRPPLQRRRRGAALTSPPTCGPNQTTRDDDPVVGQPGRRTPERQLHPDLGARAAAPARKRWPSGPFAPGFAPARTSAKAGAFSPSRSDIARGDGQQELKGVDVTLPPGMTGKLAGLAYCPEAALAAAARQRRRRERAASSCPADSLVGSASITAGSGPAPLQDRDGKAFLSGPYNGAPLSLAVITPATAGPFDLGTVVVRVALFVDPETAQIHAVSDPIPHVYGGALLNVRSVALTIDRPEFTLNPTSCEPLATSAARCAAAGQPDRPGGLQRLRGQLALPDQPTATRSASSRSCPPS